MMDIDAFTAWIQNHRSDIIRDLFSLVAIPSISDPTSEIKPFGKPCQDALDWMYALAASDGLSHEDYDRMVGQIQLTEGDPHTTSIGIWCHLDVVPVPHREDWVYPPFQGTEVEGRYLIGRDIQDNKMPAIAVYYVFRYLREIGTSFHKDWRLYLGTSEENGMEDVRQFVSKYPCPDFSLVPDTGFPVCIAQRGSQVLRYRIPMTLPEGEGLRFHCGSNISVTPEKVFALFESGPTLFAFGHAALVYQADDDNAILQMLERLADFCFSSAPQLKQAKALLSSPEQMGIAYADEASGKLIAKPTQMHWENGMLYVDVFCILPVTSDADALLSQAQSHAQQAGLSCERFTVRKPCFFPEAHPYVQTLTDVYQRVTGDTAEPFIMTGGNYASLIPNALGYGPGMPGRQFPKHIFRPGHGDYHQCDESEDWEHIVKFMQVYAEAILQLDQI